MAQAAGGPRFTFFGGKGGVGKTTCAAAAAVRGASEGARVLVVSTDPAHSLSDALGLELGAEPRPVRGVAGLHAAELDADRALSRWLRDREEAIRTITSRGTYFDDDDIDRFLSLSFPGVDELVGLLELLRLSRIRPVDEVVVDTAPTGHTLRLLEMPDTLARLGQVLDDMHAKHRFLASSLGGGWRPDFADETIAGIEREVASVRELLGDPSRASFTWVTLPEELPARESELGVRAIEALGVRVGRVVINRMWPAPVRPCPLCTPRSVAERAWRERIGAAFADRTVLEIPARIEEPRGPAALLDVARSVERLDLRRPAERHTKAAAPARITPSATPSLLAPSVRLALFGGKGGVGKTTVAAASAIELAESRPGARVLLLSTDPAHSLGDALGATIGDAPRRIAGAPSNLEARELDAAKAWDVERTRYRRAIDDLFASIFRGRMDAAFDRQVLEDLLDLAPPGIDELLAIVTLLDALVDAPVSSALHDPGAEPLDTGSRRRAERYDVVVVDTAPTGHTLRLLALPERALEWVHALMSVILKYRSVIGLGELASDLTHLARRLRSLIALLADPGRCAFVIVTRPAALPSVETERLARDLRGLRVPLSAIVANAVTEPACARCRAAGGAEHAEIARLERLTLHGRAPRLITAPAVYPGPRGPAALRAWRLAWSERGSRRA